MTTLQIEALDEHACAVADLTGEMLRYIDATDIAHTYPAQALVLRQLLAEVERRAGLLIDMTNGD